MRQQVLMMTSLLNRWCQVRADLLFAFEQAEQANLDPKLKTAIRQMLIRIRGGMQLDHALEQFRTYSDHEHFQDLIVAIRTNLRGGGDLPALLESMEWQFYKLEEAYQTRKVVNASDFKTTVLFVLAVPVIIIIRIFFWPNGLSMLPATSGGIGLVLIGTCSYLIALAALVRIRKKLVL